NVIVTFVRELRANSQAVIAQFAHLLAGEGRRVLLHPLPLYNNSVGAQDLLTDGKEIDELLDAAGQSVRAMYVAGSLLPTHLKNREADLHNLKLVVVQLLYQT